MYSISLLCVMSTIPFNNHGKITVITAFFCFTLIHNIYTKDNMYLFKTKIPVLRQSHTHICGMTSMSLSTPTFPSVSLCPGANSSHPPLCGPPSAFPIYQSPRPLCPGETHPSSRPVRLLFPAEPKPTLSPHNGCCLCDTAMTPSALILMTEFILG